MSACDTCSSPGACCKDFALNVGLFDKDSWKDDAAKKMVHHKLPFIPLRLAVEGNETAGGPSEIDGRVSIRFSCPLVTPEGLCGDYENRPQLCKDYQPLSDRLCAMYVEPVTEDQL